jgi:hypothetical protein
MQTLPHAMLSAGSVLLGVFTLGLMHSLCYFKKCIRSEIRSHYVIAICVIYFLYFLLEREKIICDNEERHAFVAVLNFDLGYFRL